MKGDPPTDVNLFSSLQNLYKVFTRIKLFVSKIKGKNCIDISKIEILSFLKSKELKNSKLFSLKENQDSFDQESL